MLFMMSILENNGLYKCTLFFGIHRHLLKLDQATTTMDHSPFASILVKLDASKPLLGDVMALWPELAGYTME